VRRKDLAGPGREPPVLLVKWYDLTRWILEKVDSFPKSQRFIFGTRLADHAIDVLETLVEASYSREKAELLATANRKVETLRWLVRLAKDRKVLSEKQYLFASQGLAECGRMLGGWLKQAASKEQATPHGGRFEASQAPV
jgi:hypothetical protein